MRSRVDLAPCAQDPRREAVRAEAGVERSFAGGRPGKNPRDGTPLEGGIVRYPLVARLTSLTTVAMGAALGLIVGGVLAVIGGSYAHKVVHDQLAPQKVSFAPAGSPQLPPDIKQYAGKPVLDGPTAKVFADKYISRHLQKIGGGKTYSEVSAASLANPSNAKLAALAQTLFRGETLRGLLLNAWGWGVVGTVALIAGWVLIGIGAILFLLPLLNAMLNGRRRATAGGSATASPFIASGGR
jgi:hypothetical protein